MDSHRWVIYLLSILFSSYLYLSLSLSVSLSPYLYISLSLSHSLSVCLLLLPPLYRYPILLLAAIRPRSFWPEYFWTNKDFIQFTYDNARDQLHGQQTLQTKSFPAIPIIEKKLEQLFPSTVSTASAAAPSSSASSLPSSKGLKALIELFETNELSLSSLSSLHLRTLSYSVSATSLPFYSYIFPLSTISQWIDQQIKDLLYLDSLLYSELEDLSILQKQSPESDLLHRDRVRSSQRQGRETIRSQYQQMNNKDEDLEVSRRDPIKRLTDKELIKLCSQRGLISYQEISESEDEAVTNRSHTEDSDEPSRRDDIAEEMILMKGKWDRVDMERRLKDWLILSKKIQQDEMTKTHLTSLVSHLIVLGSIRKSDQIVKSK
jgi:hypothetical protein